MVRHYSLSYFALVLLTICTWTSQAQETDQQLQLLGQQFVDAINTRDAQAVNNLFDFQAIASAAANSLSDNPKAQQDFQAGLSRGLTQLGQRFVQDMETQGGSARYLRIRELYGVRGALVRYDLDTGYNYLLIKTNNNKISDLHIATNGQWLSDSLGAVSQLMIAPSKSLLSKLFDRVEVDNDTLDKVRRIGTLRRQGNITEAYAILREFPPQIRNKKIVINIALQMAVQLSEVAYRQELNRLARFHKDDPSTAFMLIDHYYYQSDFDAAMDVIDNMAQAYGNDGVINLFKANIEIERGNLAKATAYTREGINLEPDNEEIYWSLLSATVLAKDYVESIDTLNTLETDFDYYFTADNFSNEEFYADFIQSPQYAEWIKGR